LCARWQRYVPFHAGTYRFTVFADDGVRLWVDDRLLIEQWQDQAATYSADIALSAGYHRVRLEYYEGSGSAGVRLGWESTTPQNFLYLPLILKGTGTTSSASSLPSSSHESRAIRTTAMGKSSFPPAGSWPSMTRLMGWTGRTATSRP